MKNKELNKLKKLYNELVSLIGKEIWKRESRKDAWNRITAKAGKSDFIK